MPDWSIKIVESGGTTSFAPVTLDAMQDDLVCWNNKTAAEHQPWPADENYVPLTDVPRTSTQYMSDPIAPGGSSRPSYDVAQPAPVPPATVGPNNWTVYYVCKNHPTVESERGIITGQVPS